MYLSRPVEAPLLNLTAIKFFDKMLIIYVVIIGNNTGAYCLKIIFLKCQSIQLKHY
jgi:hypothetical protein